MARAIRHRGPDAEGIWVDAEAGVALGHCRLSIVDLSEAGAQPMISASGRYVLSYNGEIYNFRNLRRRLEERGQAFRGHSDTEVLLACIDAWGLEETLRRVQGMFAFALWDCRERRLILARDRVGKKPLYYGWHGETFLFGSELRALRAHPGFNGTVDRAALGQLLRCGWIAQPRAIFEGIRKLPPATFVVVDPQNWAQDFHPQAYWSAKEHVEAGEAAPFTGSPEEAVDELDALLRDAVAGRMVADVDLGALLSGGVDSSLVVAIMQALSGRPVKTFSVGFEEPRYDEAPHAKAIADYLKTDHHEVYLKPADSLEVVQQVARIYDEPFADSSQIPSYLISRVAREQVTVVLSGDGGDELFGGYRRYHEILGFWRRWGGLTEGLRSLAGGAVAGLGRAAWGVSAAGAVPWSRVAAKWERDGRRFAAASPRDLLARYLSAGASPQALLRGEVPAPSVLDRPEVWAEVTDPLQAMMHLDFIGYLPDDILVKLDRASMAASLEARCPLLDHRIAEFAWRLPRGLRVDGAGGKKILRDLLARYVPPELTERPKQGFSVPVAAWLRGPLKDWAEDYLAEDRLARQGFFEPAEVRRLWDQHRTGWCNHTKVLWAMLVFQMWLDEYG